MDIYLFKQLGAGEAKAGIGEEGDWTSSQVPSSFLVPELASHYVHCGAS
jgi:hypothetical protein